MSVNKVLLLRNIGVCIFFATLLMLVGQMIPALSLFMIVIANAPMVFLSIQYKIQVPVSAALVSIVILVVISGSFLGALLYGVMCLVPGIVIGRSINGHFGFTTIVGAGAGVILFVLVLQIILINAGETGIEDLVEQALENIRLASAEAVSLLGGKNSGQALELQRLLNGVIERVRGIIYLYFPSFFIGASVILSYLIFMVGVFILNRTKVRRIIYRPFWGIVAPRSMCHLAVMLFLITTFSLDTTIWTMALKNMLALLYGYFAICGFSFIDWKLRRKISSGYARGMIYLAGFFLLYFLMGVVFSGLSILGMLDGMMGFRRLYKAGEEYGRKQ